MYVGYCVSLSRAFIMFIECVTKQLFLLNVFFQSRKCKLRVKSFWLRKRVRAAKSFLLSAFHAIFFPVASEKSTRSLFALSRYAMRELLLQN
jgi:hypothetical protein